MPSGIYKKIWGNKTPTPKERFWSKVNKTDTCWEWIGVKNKDGYGITEINRKTYRAHRASWEIHYGEIPKGMYVCHHCDNPPCINPNHLFLGTQKDNIHDMLKKERRPSRKGEKNYSAKLTESQVRNIRKLWKAGNLTQRKIAEVFNVHRTMIGLIVRNKNWKHMKD